MEHITLKLDDGSGEAYDALLEESRKEDLPDYGDLTICTKKKATQGGQTGVMMAFHVKDKATGKKRRVQTVTTLNNFLTAAKAIEAAEQR